MAGASARRKTTDTVKLPHRLGQRTEPQNTGQGLAEATVRVEANRVLPTTRRSHTSTSRRKWRLGLDRASPIRNTLSKSVCRSMAG